MTTTKMQNFYEQKMQKNINVVSWKLYDANDHFIGTIFAKNEVDAIQRAMRKGIDAYSATLLGSLV